MNESAAAAVLNQGIRAERGEDGEIVIIAAWCAGCETESMPARDGECMFCGQPIVDYDSLSAREVLAMIDGEQPEARVIPLHPEPVEPAESPPSASRELVLRLTPDLDLPIDVAGEAIAILAKRGAGKTNTGRVLAEELVGAGVQIVVIDPVGAWWGLRASADGAGDGLPLAIVGGAHGDVDVSAWMGAVCAWSVVEEGRSLLIDLSDLAREQQREFVADFADELYRLKARNHELVHVILEEADEFAPQAGPRGRQRRKEDEPADPRLAIETLARRGRSRGIGLTMITQRSAALSKDILTQADILLALRTTGPTDIKAIKAWVEKHADGGDDVVASLPSLKTGEGWVWNPEREILQRVKFRLARTFDSSATPRFGETAPAPDRMAEVEPLELDAAEPMRRPSPVAVPAYKLQDEDGLWGCKTTGCEGRSRQRVGPNAFLCDDCAGRTPAPTPSRSEPDGVQVAPAAGRGPDGNAGLPSGFETPLEVDGEPIFGLTGYFDRDAERARGEAARLRAQADALDRIAEQFDLLASMQQELFP